jgi:hypothetical protein
MGLIRDNKGANISVAQVNGYTKENVIKAKRYLREIGKDRRNFPVERLVQMYNEIKNTNEKPQGCQPCQITKFYNGIQNYAYFGELTLINNNRCTKDDLDLDKIDAAQAEEPQPEKVEEDKKSDIKERMAKVRAAKKAKKEEND